KRPTRSSCGIRRRKTAAANTGRWRYVPAGWKRLSMCSSIGSSGRVDIPYCIGRSVPDVLRVQGPRLVHVAGAFDDCPAVREDSELEAVGVELQEEAVVADLAEHLEVFGQVLEVEPGGAAVGDLDGVAAAQARRLRPVGAVEPLETAPLAARAIDFAQER